MIIGHGIDVTELLGIESHLKIDGWLERVMHPEEIKNVPDNTKRLSHIAGRFAAKEAILKALGCGFGNGVAFTDIQILRDEGSPPSIVLLRGAKKRADELKIKSWHLSISHTATTAFASAIAE